MKIGLLFGGQGSQEVGMGKDFYEEYEKYREVFDLVDMDFPLRDYSFNGELDLISKTEYTQPIMVAFQLGVTRLLREKGIIPEYLAGLSIGEYGALAASGVLEEKDALEIAYLRGKAMENTISINSKMVAVLGLEEDKIREILSSLNEGNSFAEISNINCPGQIVVSGQRKIVEQAEVEFEKSGAKRIIELNVSGPFHTSYMKDASEILEEHFRKVDFKEERIPLVYNYLGRERREENIDEIMVNQVKSTVLFENSIKYLIDKGVDTFIEIGFSDVLKKFIKKIDRKIKVYGVYDMKSLNSLLEEVLV